MEENKSNEESREKIRDENAFLKMKLMLEHGAQFGTEQTSELPPEIENMFLHNVMAFENQLKDQEEVKVFDLIGRPDHFLPVAEISDADMHDAWNELKAWLNQHSIDLNSCSPHVTERELYRFTIEELFDHGIFAMNLPGWNYNFIYDEFHPDPVYEATNAALWGIRGIFRKEPLKHDDPRFKGQLRLNRNYSLDPSSFCKVINCFKESFEEIVLTSTKDVKCTLGDNHAEVTGLYRAKCKLGAERIIYRGQWSMYLEMAEKDQWWMISGIQLEGIEF